MKNWEARAKEIAEKAPYLSVATILKVKKGKRGSKCLSLSVMAKKALSDAIKRFDLEGHETELIVIASAIAGLTNKVFIEAEDVAEAYQLFTGDY